LGCKITRFVQHIQTTRLFSFIFLSLRGQKETIFAETEEKDNSLLAQTGFSLYICNLFIQKKNKSEKLK